MINNTRRGTFTVAAVAVGVILAGGAAGASVMGAGPLAVEDTTTTLDTTTTVGDTSTTADPSTTIETSTTLDGSTTTEVATTVPQAAPTTVETTVPDTRGPDPTGPAAYGLCRAFADRAGQPGTSQAWARLNEQAGGDIQGWCAAVLADKAAKRGHDDAEEPETTEPRPSTTVATPPAVQSHAGTGQGSGNAPTTTGRAAAGANGAAGGNSEGHGKG